MKPEAFSLHRRNIVERRVLRGENIASLSESRPLRTPIPDQALIQSDLEKFSLLKREAARNGLNFRDVDSNYTDAEELQILSWLAAYQRVGGLT